MRNLRLPPKCSRKSLISTSSVCSRKKNISVDSVVQELIELLHGRGIKLAIISSREAENLNRIVKRLGLADFFDFVQGRDADLTSKAEFIRRFAASNMLQFNDIIFVGDSDRDCEAAEEAGVRYYHTTWAGEPTSIAHSKANVRFDSPQDLLACVKILPFRRALQTALCRRL